MELIKFEDDVIITRGDGEPNEFDQIVPSEVWSGKGRYQQGGQVYTGFLVRNSVLFLPEDVAVEENDKAIVTLTNGRKISGVVGTVKNVRLPLTYERQTRMELKQVMDVRYGESKRKRLSEPKSERP